MPSFDEPLDDLPEPGDAPASDAELITAVRAGDEQAFGLLWQRHEAAALRLAQQLGSPSNAEDLVSESFARLLRVLRQGGGPDGAFRPYLFSTLRRLNIDNARSYGQRVSLTDDEGDLEGEPVQSAAEVAAGNAENSAAWRAWASLPDSSRTLLWHLIVEEETPAQIAPLIGTSANGVSSRALRARERLRQAFLQQHVAETLDENCRWTRSRMGEYVRDALSARDRAAVQAHLDECDTCPAVLFEITDVNQTLRVVIAPIVLGGVSLAAYTGFSGAGGGPAAGGGAQQAVGHHFSGARIGSTAMRGVLVGAAGVVIAAGIATAAAVGLQDSSHNASAGSPTTAVSPTTSAPASTAASPPPASSAAGAPVIVAAPPSAPLVSAASITRAVPRPTRRPTPKVSTTSVVIPPNPATTSPTSPTATPMQGSTTPTAPVTIPGQAHFIRFGSSADPNSPGTVELSVPSTWTIQAVHITSPTAGWTCASTAVSVRCDIPAPDAVTEYDYTIDLTGPADDHTSTESITYANGAFSDTITPLINP